MHWVPAFEKVVPALFTQTQAYCIV